MVMIKRQAVSTFLFSCAVTLLLGFMLSFMVTTALAASDVRSVYSTNKYFAVGPNSFFNFCGLTYNEGNKRVLGSVSNLQCENTDLPAGYLGSKAEIYKQTSSNRYSIYSSGEWFYSASKSWSITNGTRTVTNTPKGNYMCKGQTAVYYNGSYKTQQTYDSPALSVY